MVLDCTIIFLSCWSKLTFSVYKCTNLDEKAQPRRECTSKLSPSPPQLCHHYFLFYPGAVRNVEESSYLLYFPWWMSQNISWLIKHLKAMWRFQQTVYFQVVATSLVTLNKAFYFSLQDSWRYRAMSFPQWHRLSCDSLGSKAKCHCHRPWHLRVSLMDPNIITLGLSATLWLKSVPLQKNPKLWHP